MKKIVYSFALLSLFFTAVSCVNEQELIPEVITYFDAQIQGR